MPVTVGTIQISKS